MREEEEEVKKKERERKLKRKREEMREREEKRKRGCENPYTQNKSGICFQCFHLKTKRYFFNFFQLVNLFGLFLLSI